MQQFCECFPAVPHDRTHIFKLNVCRGEPLLQLLQLMQLRDGTLPIGAAAHSFGLETLTEWSLVQPATLDSFIDTYLQEQAPSDCCYVRAAFVAALHSEKPSLLCQRLDAMRQARETRDASVCLGQRLLTLCLDIVSVEVADALRAAFHNESTHQVVVIGYIGALLQFGDDETAAAFLQQTVATLVSSAQRLIAVGQRQSMSIQWNKTERIVSVVKKSRSEDIFTVNCFMPLLDIGSMRHPRLETRLFLS
jgi:urease accessory protein